MRWVDAAFRRGRFAAVGVDMFRVPQALPRAVVACLCVSIFAVGAAERLRIAPAEIAKAGIEVAAIQGREGAVAQGLPAQVAIPAGQLRVVSAPLAALVESVPVATLQTVRRGQVLARLVSPGLADLQHTYLQASAQHQLAATALARDEKLHEEGIIAASRLEAARARAQEVAADLAERTAALNAAGMSADSIARLKSGRAVGTGITLTAPFDATVLEQYAVPGQRLEAAAPVLKLAQLAPLWLEIQVPVAQAAGVAVGAPVQVPAAGVTGRVIAVGRAVSGSTQTIAVRAEVKAGAERLKAGQLVEATLGSATIGGGALEVPSGALARRDGRARVYAEAEGGFAVVEVQVVEENAERALVKGDLAPGRRIAVKGVATLKAIESGIGGVR
jgi:RND family efflux transporter MFP subunit